MKKMKDEDKTKNEMKAKHPRMKTKEEGNQAKGPSKQA